MVVTTFRYDILILNSDKIEYYTLRGGDISHGGLFQRVLLHPICRVPRLIRGTSSYVGYLKLLPSYEGYLELLSSYARYLELCQVPRIMLELFRSSTRGNLLLYLFFPQTDRIAKPFIN